jgi:transcription elongation factor GreA
VESSQSITLSEAVRLYVDSIKSKDSRNGIHKELFRFLNWCGPDRTLFDLSPPEIGDYAERMTGVGASSQATDHLQAVRRFLSYSRKKGLIERNLAQHVRIPKSKARSASGSAETQNVVELTAEGHSRLETQLETLKAERAPLAQQIRRAAADRDVRENAPLEAAREQLGHVEARIRTIEGTLKSAVIIDSSSLERVPTIRLGTRVVVKEVNGGREVKCTLVDRTEASPLEGRISDVSPLGKALKGNAAGQEVEASTPRGKIRYRILKVTS